MTDEQMDHLRMAAEDAVPLPVLNALQSAIGEYERAVLAQGLAPLDTVKRLYQAARAVIDPKGRVEFGEVTASVEAERDRYIRTLLRVPARHLPSCPAQVLDGVKVVEGDYCRDCPHRPDNVEYTGKDCWAVWQARVRGADAATEEAPDEPVDA